MVHIAQIAGRFLPNDKDDFVASEYEVRSGLNDLFFDWVGKYIYIIYIFPIP